MFSYVKCFAKDNNKIDIIYFSSPTCSSCEKADKFLSEMKENNFNLYKYDISTEKGKKLLNSYCEYYKVPEKISGIAPIVFIGENYLYGKDSIINDLVTTIQNNLNNNTIILNESDLKQDIEKFKEFNYFYVFLAGLINGFNPCSLSLLIFFISLLITSNLNIKKNGFSFVAGKFVSFFLLGTIFYKLLSYINVSFIIFTIKIIFVVTSLIFAVLNLYDFIVLKKNHMEKMILKLPKAIIKFNNKMSKKVQLKKSIIITMLLCFAVGALIACTEFLCSGQVYLSTIVTILQYESQFTLISFLYMIIYDVAFCLPLFISIIILSKTKNHIYISKKLVAIMPYIKLITAIFFTIISVILLLS